MTSEGKELYLSDIWPSREEVQQTEEDTVISSIFKELRGRMKVRRRSSPAVFLLLSHSESLFTILLRSLPEREHVLEQHRKSRFCAFPLGSQVHLYPLAVLFQQVGEFNVGHEGSSQLPLLKAAPLLLPVQNRKTHQRAPPLLLSFSHRVKRFLLLSR